MPRKIAKSTDQLGLFQPASASPQGLTATTTFARNHALPIHNWFRYSAGFSGEWANATIAQAVAEGRRNFLDPFAGSGTAVLEAASQGMNAIGVDAHPFVARVARTKLAVGIDSKKLRFAASGVLVNATNLPIDSEHESPLVMRCYSSLALSQLNALRKSIALLNDETAYGDLLWLALASILRGVSHVGTASWQYVLPKKTKALKRQEPFEAFEDKVETMCLDIDEMREVNSQGIQGHMFLGDARSLGMIADKWADFVITSPPYANNFDYADATRLEMSFFNEIASWSDLHPQVRKDLICSCSQHASIEKHPIEVAINSKNLDPIRSELIKVCAMLESVKFEHGGKKNYDWMIARYFADMAAFFTELRRVTAEKARVVVVIGDSAPYGVYVPVDDWFEKIALHVGFNNVTFLKRRDRNLKWKNRKHTVPLKEGELWLDG